MMTLEEFKSAQRVEVKPAHKLTHPIYGAGRYLKPANQSPFIWCVFDNPSSDRMQVLAVSQNVCGAA